MGGRGASNSRGNSDISTEKPSYFAETDKAVQLQLQLDDPVLERDIIKKVWVPKSQLSEDGRPSHWITERKIEDITNNSSRFKQSDYEWKDAKGNSFRPGTTKKELDAQKSYKSTKGKQGNSKDANILKEAKDLGIKPKRGEKISDLKERMDKKLAKKKK